MVAQTQEFESPTTVQTLHSYLDRGWNIFPIEANGKRPVVVSTGTDEQGQPFEIRFKWKEFETIRATKAQVSKWYMQFPNCNWAVVCGKISGICVVDVDGSEGAESVKKYHPELDKIRTLVQKSPRGFHLLFKHPGNPVKSFPILPKVDVKGDGGYIVISPSRTVDGEYRIVMDEPLATCPGWVARGERTGFDEEAPSSPAGDDAQPMWVSELLTGGSPSGRRNSDAAKLVGYFWNRNVSRDIIERIITPWAERCQPPLDIKEMKSVVRSVCSYQQMAKNRGVADPPTMTSTGVGWKFEWDSLGVDIEISKVVENERYGLVGEIEVHTSIPAFPKYLYGPMDYAFKSGQSQTALISALEKRMNGLPWSQIVTDMSRLAIGQFGRNSDWQLLRDVSRSVSFGYAYKPLLLAREPTLWFSAGGGMKSYLALLMGVMLETGLDLGIGPALVRHHVAYLDWEWDGGQHAKRLDAIISPDQQERLGVNMIYQNCSGRPLRKQLDELKRLISDEGITYVIIDSASPACGRASDNDEIVSFFQAISELRVGALILAHITKTDRQGEEGASMAYGGVQWENQARTAWNLKKIQEEGSNFVDLILTHKKVNGGPLSLPVSFRVQFPDENDASGMMSIAINDTDEMPKSRQRSAEGTKLWDQIKAALKRPMTLSDLADELDDITVQELDSIMKSFEGKGVTRVVRMVDGKMMEYWGLRTAASR